MYYPKWKNYYFQQKEINIPDKWLLLRRLGKDNLSTSAQEKLEWIIFYFTLGNQKVTATAAYFGTTRKTLHKYLSRFDERDLTTLEEQSRCPHATRGWTITDAEETNITDLRKRNMELGKKKLKVLYRKEYKTVITTWKIEQVIRKYKLYPDKVKHDKKVERRQRSKAKIRIHQVKEQVKQVDEFGFLWHIDAIIIWWYGQRRIIFTALEDKTKIAFARVYTANTSGLAEDFLKRLMYLVEGQIDIMHSDNGAEFQGDFEKACKALHIIQIYSRPYTPKDNPALERFNSTIQKEWLDYSEVGLDYLLEANSDLTIWLIKYNSYRPHEALDYLTPLEYAHEHFFKVSPMYPARTLSCVIAVFDLYLNQWLK